MKSNPYVYPYIPFFDLSKKEFKAKFSQKILTKDEIAKILNAPPPLKIRTRGATPAEKILNIFLDKEVLFGPKEYITDTKKEWIKRFNYFIEKKQPIRMTLLGFPFKMPIPLKTDRTLPDLGETLAVKRLHELIKAVKEVYGPGATITIITEGVFGRFNHMNRKEYDNYEIFLRYIIEEFGFGKEINTLRLEDMEKLSTNFATIFQEKVKKLEGLYRKSDTELLKKYNGAKESIYRIVNTKRLHIPTRTLMDVYNDSISNEKVSKTVRETRHAIEKEMHKMLIRYLAYLMVRDDLNFIEKTIPHAITLSVSPKPNRLGIIPVASHCIRLPYHGVPVYHPAQNKFTIEYLVDILRTPASYKKIYWKNDKERKPFFYVKH